MILFGQDVGSVEVWFDPPPSWLHFLQEVFGWSARVEFALHPTKSCVLSGSLESILNVYGRELKGLKDGPRLRPFFFSSSQNLPDLFDPALGGAFLHRLLPIVDAWIKSGQPSFPLFDQDARFSTLMTLHKI